VNLIENTEKLVKMVCNIATQRKLGLQSVNKPYIILVEKTWICC